MVRDPIVSGQFYPGGREACLRDVRRCMSSEVDPAALPSRLLGGIVPHAGWTYSGPTAGKVFAALAARRRPATVVLFGADHGRVARPAAMFGSGRWAGPLGEIVVDDRLAERVASMTQLVSDDPFAHEQEHSIEVQIPFVQQTWGEAKILPIIVSPTVQSVDVGKAVGRAIDTYKLDAVVIGSSDLTHYGANYGFTPRGIGEGALRWAKDVNDRHLIDRVLALDAEGVIPLAATEHSACGAGAIAATIAACRQMGASRAALLEHTTSCEVGRQAFGDSAAMAVGYAGIILG